MSERWVRPSNVTGKGTRFIVDGGGLAKREVWVVREMASAKSRVESLERSAGWRLIKAGVCAASSVMMVFPIAFAALSASSRSFLAASKRALTSSGDELSGEE